MIKLEKITKKFDTRIILNDINLEVPKGNLLILTGPSGSGKTTIIRIIAGLDVPDTGTVYINKNVVSKDTVLKINPHQRNVGMVFQDFALWPHLTVYQNISFALKAAKVEKIEIENRIQEICKFLDIDKLINMYPSKLSGGEKQRVAFARSLAVRPAILLLDEPLSNIDRKHKAEMLSYIEEFRTMYNSTVIFITHSRSDIEILNGRVVTVENGKISCE